MSDSEQILDVIDVRLVEVRSEIAALQAARAALIGQLQAKGATRRGPGRPKRPTHVPAPPPASRAAGSDGSASPSAATAPRSRGTSKPPRSVRTRRAKAMLNGAIENILRENPEGLSAAALTKVTGASHAGVTTRLRELEQAGEVRRSGARRTSRWRIVSGEEQIAERAAELEKTRSRAELAASRHAARFP